jgi:hypothetical protein
MSRLCTRDEIISIYQKLITELSEDSKKIIKPTIIPSQFFHAAKWDKKEVKVLFIAESPPWSFKNKDKRIESDLDCRDEDYVYFYNEGCKNNFDGLANTIFQKLKIKGETREEKLRDFRHCGYMLTDSIKCILNKRYSCDDKFGKKRKIKNSVLKKIAEYSTRKILISEIDTIQPTTIVVLGKTALLSLKEAAKSSSHLKKQSGLPEELTDINDFTNIESDQKKLFQYNIILMPFPNNMNKRYQKAIDDGFSLIHKNTI